MPALAVAFIRVRPDTTGFRAETDRQLGRIRLTKPVALTPDASGFKQQAIARLARVRMAPIRVPVNPDTTGLGRTTERAARPAGTRAGQVLSTAMTDKLNTQLRTLNLPELNLKANPADINRAITATREHLGMLARDADNIELRMQAGQAMAELTRFDRQLNRFAGSAGARGEESGRRFGAGFGKGADSSNTFTRVAAIMAARMALIGGAAAAALPSVLHLTAALAPAAGAVTVLPAALLAGAAAAGTFRVATSGVADAIGKGLTGTAAQAKKALDALPPSARVFAASIIALKPQIDALKQSVAQHFFKPLQDEVGPLARTLFPLLRTQMTGVAGALGGLGEEIAQSARSAETFGAVRAIFVNTRLSLNNLRDAVFPLTAALSSLITATAPFLPGLASGFADLAQRVAVFVDTAAQSGRISAAFQAAMTTLRDLGGIAANVGSILGSVFRAASVGSGSLLGNLRLLTGQVAAFLRSAQGSAALTAVFSTLSTLGAALRTSLAAVLPAVARSLGTIGPAIAGLAGPASRMVVALAPLLPYFTQIAAIIIERFTPAIAKLAGWMERNQSLMKVLASAIGGIVVAMKIWTAVQWAFNFAMTANPITLVIAGLVALGAALILAYNKSAVFRAFVDKLWASLKVAFGQIGVAVTNLKNTWNNVWTAMANIITNLVRTWNNVYAALRNSWIALMNVLGNVRNTWNNVWNAMANTIRAVWAAIKVSLDAAHTFVRVTLPNAFRFLVQQVTNSINGWKLVISAGWAVVRGVFTAIHTFVTVSLVAGFRAFATIVGTIWRTFGAGVRAIWDSIRTGSFAPLRTFITVTLPGAFRTGVEAIRRAWAAVQAAAKVPVTFVVRSVINPLIRGYNAIAGVFHAPQAHEITGFAAGGGPVDPRLLARARPILARARGGIIPGAASPRDNRMAALTDTAGRVIGNLKVATGEFITNARSTAENLPWLRWANAGGRFTDLLRAGPQHRRVRGVDTARDGLPGFQFGGLIDWAKGLISKGKAVVTKVFDVIADPSKALSDLVNRAINAIPGGGSIRDTVVGMGRGLVRGVIDKIKSFFTAGGVGGIGANASPGFPPWPSSPGASRGDSGVWRNIVALIKSTGPVSGSFGNAYRAGDPLWHGSGRAVDWMGYNQDTLATFLANRRPLELIHRTGRRDYAYTRGQNRGSFNNALMQAHRNHVHIAMQLGGLLKRLTGRAGSVVRLMDRGGAFPSGAAAVNTSGHTEHVLTGGPTGEVAELAALLRAILAALLDNPTRFAAALGSNSREALRLGRGAPVPAGRAM